MYTLLQPDGSLRSVSYTADNQNGFRATVRLDSPGLPVGPTRPGAGGGGVPTSSVSSSAARGTAGSRPSVQQFQFPSRPAAPAATPPRTPTTASSGASTGASSSASTSTIEPASGGEAGVSQPQALRASPLAEDGDDSAWKVILGSSPGSSSPSARPSGGEDISQLFGGHDFPPHTVPGGQPPWLEHNSVGGFESSSDQLMLAGPDYPGLQAGEGPQVHPPVRLPLEHEVTASHYVFAEPTEGHSHGHEHGLQEAADDSMRQLMRRQRARKRHVGHPGGAVGHPTILRVRHLRQHHPPRWTWVAAKE
ncbi:uncharacterized protein LOC127749628 [Frankliniella occidentalis]|uniref:Uncharacterized protein LOC127749628 n=1 Tax=Frankliniella occidentalis TaxID=133901 RepID=A0A9C6U3F1_FRAOC|nr:uncharacterized protein LOC127749628 [Frankliniella occidentalis]